MSIRIHDADNRAIRRRVFSFERKTRFLAATPKDQFADSRSNRINGNEWLARRLEVFIQGLDNQQLSSLKRLVLNCGHDCSDDASKLHNVSSSEFRVSSFRF